MMKPGQKVGRREPCPCGSGLKYKSCCFAKDRDTAEHLAKSVKKARAPRKPKAAIDKAPVTKEESTDQTVVIPSGE